MRTHEGHRQGTAIVPACATSGPAVTVNDGISRKESLEKFEYSVRKLTREPDNEAKDKKRRRICPVAESSQTSTSTRTPSLFVLDQAMKALAEQAPCLGVFARLNGTMPEAAESFGLTALGGFFDAMLRGTSQVFLASNPLSGIIICLALFIPGDDTADAWTSAAFVALSGILALFSATLSSILLGIDYHAIRCGLYGYNGILVGMGLATFLEGEWDVDGLAVILMSIILGAASVILQTAIDNFLLPTFMTPPFTLAFNITTIPCVLACASKFHHYHVKAFLAPVLRTWRNGTLSSDAYIGDCPDSTDLGWVLRATFTSIGQVFLCNSWRSGLLMVFGIAFHSRIATLAAVAGSGTAVLFALALAAPCDEIKMGLWGYNSTLTAIAVLTFFVPSRKCVMMALAAVFMTVVTDGAFKTIAAPLGSPVGTLPFCVVAIAMVLTQGKVKGFDPVPIAHVSTPEDHLIAATADREDGHRQAFILSRACNCKSTTLPSLRLGLTEAS